MRGMLAKHQKSIKEKEHIENEISVAVGFWNEISVKKEELKKLHRLLTHTSKYRRI
jgi:hypothetical protein